MSACVLVVVCTDITMDCWKTQFLTERGSQLLEYFSAQMIKRVLLAGWSLMLSVDCNVGTQNTHSQVDLSGVDDDLFVVS